MNALSGTERAALVRSVRPYCWRTAWRVARPVLGARHLRGAFEAAELAAWESASRYDPASGWKFLTFAWRRIGGAVADYVRAEAGRGSAERASVVLGLLADRAPDPAEVAAANDLRAYVRRQVARLPARLRLVIELRYGFDRPAPMLAWEVGRRLGVTQTRASQLEHKALARLRWQMGATA